MTGALDDAMRLRAVEFAYRGSDEEQIGFIAQDVAPVFPSLVEEGDLLTLNYSGLSVVAIAALQDLKREKDAEIRTLRERNAALEARLERLEALVTEALAEGGGLGVDLGASLGSNLGGGS